MYTLEILSLFLIYPFVQSFSTSKGVSELLGPCHYNEQSRTGLGIVCISSSQSTPRLRVYGQMLFLNYVHRLIVPPGLSPPRSL